ncbi:MAG: alanine--tRNA ligase [Gammaproteobacteria bacterium]|nr:alanine--tRNA ligase [Gammaproteobacteria bacterium]
MISTAELRKLFLDYFAKQGHTIVPSGPLVPANDPTLLFTNAGMVPFKDVFLGREKRSYTRATTTQRCVRAGGKHNDLENVGYTARHHTFFEMLGNFSFGDYFKEEAIAYAWEFLTQVLKIPKEKLWVTVYEEDDEAYALWEQKIGVSRDRIARIGAKDNFWQMGDTGPCGPCSEIFYDHGPDVWGGPPGTPEEDGDRYIEIWNLVFMQFDRAADGTLAPLPAPCVDTGMGLERLAAVMQHVHSNYEIDLFQNLLKAVAVLTRQSDLENSSLRVIADHIRSCAFLIVDGVTPSNEGRGYVLRRIIRRAARHAHKLGITEPVFHRLVSPLAQEMGEAFPELARAQQQVEGILLKEEQRFNETLSQGMKILEDDIQHLKTDVIPGETLFRLYDTYGFPVDLTADIARERNLKIDLDGFEKKMEAQRSRARSASQFQESHLAGIAATSATRFTGYDHIQEQTHIVALHSNGQSVESLQAGETGSIILDQTPFYGESGGQVGDTGTLSANNAIFYVEDTQKTGDTIIHIGRMKSGALSCDETVTATVDEKRRQAIRLNHSATHLLHAALRNILGTHVQQKGSLVSPAYLRFDFSHGDRLTPEQLTEIEQWVNAQIRRNHPVAANEMSMDEALETGALALFGEKYGEQVRVIQMGGASVELCGGTHVHYSGDIGLFRITAESGVAAGVRRIEAVTGEEALTKTLHESQQLQALAALLKANQTLLPDKVRQLVEHNRQLEKELEQFKAKVASQAGNDLVQHAITIQNVKVLAYRLENADSKSLRETTDQLKNKLRSGVVVLGVADGGKVRLIAGVTDDLIQQIKAGDLINHVARQVGGKGGGRADMAQAGGDDPEKLDEALASVTDWVNHKLA